MKPAHVISSFVFVLAAPLIAQRAPAVPEPELTIRWESPVVEFDVVHAVPAPFVGVVLASLSPDLRHFVVDLPPLLDQSLVLAFGATSSQRFHAAVSEFVFPAGLPVYVQGVTLTETGVFASEVGSFVLDVTAPGR
jgi:hypothetical protein